MDYNFNLKLMEFVALLNSHQSNSAAKNTVPVITYISGRKYTKIIFVNSISDHTVRYFVKNSDGSIYGAKSRLAPNLNWYFGTIYNADKWDWSDFHGRSITDDTVRVVGQYGPYTHYMKI